MVWSSAMIFFSAKSFLEVQESYCECECELLWGENYSSDKVTTITLSRNDTLFIFMFLLLSSSLL